ncbi:G-type lectin S-receptor-like serine/threonine-protein kinase [Tanacetum coccineum]
MEMIWRLSPTELWEPCKFIVIGTLISLTREQQWYMSPEYALDGLFSIKSDVFSFGVVMLEIILSGKRNTGFYQSQKSMSIRLYKPLELMDQIPIASCNSSEVLKCITVGLLCVQGDPDDRPTRLMWF